MLLWVHIAEVLLWVQIVISKAQIYSATQLLLYFLSHEAWILVFLISQWILQEICLNFNTFYTNFRSLFFPYHNYRMMIKECIQKAMRTFILNPEVTGAMWNFSAGRALMTMRQILGSSTQHFSLCTTVQNFLISDSLISPNNIMTAKHARGLFPDFQGLSQVVAPSSHIKSHSINLVCTALGEEGKAGNISPPSFEQQWYKPQQISPRVVLPERKMTAAAPPMQWCGDVLLKAQTVCPETKQVFSNKITFSLLWIWEKCCNTPKLAAQIREVTVVLNYFIP